MLGISKASVDATLTLAGIQRTPYTVRVKVDSNRDASDQERNYNARITGVEVDEPICSMTRLCISPKAVR